jgi:heptosyltransferase I
MPARRRATPLYRQIDRYVGIPAAALLAAAPKRKRPPDSSIRRIGILKTAAIGDTLLLVGIPEALEKRYPAAKIVMITGRVNAGVVPLLGNGVREHAIVAPARPIAAARAIRRLRLDLLLECGPWPRVDALLGALSGARYRVGFRVKGQARHYGFDLVVDHSAAVHQLENFRQLARAVGATEFAPPEIARPGVLRRDQMPAGPYVVFHPWSGGFMGGVKEWPADRWLKLGRHLSSERGLRIVVTGGSGDVERSARMAESLTSRAVGCSAESVAASYSLVEMADLLAESAVVVSVNTGIMHLAALVGARTVSLDGPTPVRRWGPLGPHVRSAVAGGAGCGYLDLGFEYAGQRLDCMNDITVDDVMGLVDELVGER